MTSPNPPRQGRDDITDDGSRLTRRDALVAGAVLSGGILLGAAASAAAATPLHALANLRDEIRDSELDRNLRSRLLKVLGNARADLKHGDAEAAAEKLDGKLKPLLKENRGRHGLSERQARRWIGDVEEVVSQLGPGVGGPSYGNVYVFNLYPSPIRILDLNGKGRVGKEIPSPDQFSRVPANTSVPRANKTAPQLTEPQFAVGSNSVRVEFDEDPWTAQVKIPAELDPRRDLFLYIGYRDFVLVNQDNGSFIR